MGPGAPAGPEGGEASKVPKAQSQDTPILGARKCRWAWERDPGHLACPTSIPDPPRSLHFPISLILVVGNLLVLPGCAL